DAKGNFQFDGVTRGRYELHVLDAGFKPQSERVQIGDPAPAPLKILMQLADIEETLNVKASDRTVSTEASENLNAVHLGPQQLRNLPALNSDVVGAIERMLGPGAKASGGTSVLVDGMPSNERVQLSDIQEIRINKNPYSAEFARPGTNRIEIITKSGGTKYHG